MSNLVDSVSDGMVTDYLYLSWWPTVVFNLGDAAVILGAAVWAMRLADVIVGKVGRFR